MSNKKRSSEAAAPDGGQRKKAKISEPPKPVQSVLRPEEVDFPRGGGTSLTAAEYKTIRTEALKELNNEDVFKVRSIYSLFFSLLWIFTRLSFLTRTQLLVTNL